MLEASSNTPFSIDHLVTEVNTIVEDLRWLHFEQKLRNNLNELLFREVATVEEFLEAGFHGFRAKMSVLEITVYLKTRQGYSIGYRDLEASVFWQNDPVPWTDNLMSIFKQGYQSEEAPQPIVSHYTINNDPITAVAMPVVINREVSAVAILVAHSSNLIPRYKKLLSGLSVALSVSMNYIKNLRRLYKPSSSLKFADNSLPFDDVIRFLENVASQFKDVILVCDNYGNILIWNEGAERLTGIAQDAAKSLSEIQSIFKSTDNNVSAVFSAVQRGTPFAELTAPLYTNSGEKRSMLWSMRKFGTNKGTLSMLNGVQLTQSSGAGSIDQPLSSDSPQSAWMQKGISEIESVYIAVLDSSFNVLYLNPHLRKRLAVKNGVGDSFIEAFVPRLEHGYVESALSNYLSKKGSRQSHEQFHLVTSDDVTLPMDWHLGSLPGTDNMGTTLWLFGSEVPDELFQVTKELELKQFPYRSTEAKLSKHYRFLMKYVPFPIIHLDEESNEIRNANLAFEKIIGTRNWEAAPISDFGELEIQKGMGEAQPCILYILSPDGITFTYRGILTPLQIFGKNIREIKLDPLE
jgi:PAS domain-containing protein